MGNRITLHLAWHGKARRGLARRGKAWHGKARHGKARHGEARQGIFYVGGITMAKTVSLTKKADEKLQNVFLKRRGKTPKTVIVEEAINDLETKEGN